MTDTERIALLEDAIRELWGSMLAADLMIQDRYVKAVFAKADAECRKLGLIPREGVMFVERAD